MRAFLHMRGLAASMTILASLLLCSVAACGGSGKPEADSARQTRVQATDTSTRTPAIELWRDTAGCARQFEGTINNTIRISMRLCRKGETIAGSYRYVKVGKDIEIQGHVDAKGEFVIYEWGDGGDRKQTGNWLGRFIGDSILEGAWSTVKGDRSMPFRVALAGSGAIASAAAGGFSGSWSYAKDGYTFTLDLQEMGDSIVGEHCAVTKNATRVDCGSNELTGEDTHTPEGKFREPSITGRRSGTVATVRFESYYGVDSLMNPIHGTATMTLQGDRIDWKITDFVPGDFYLPMEATLKRDGKR